MTIKLRSLLKENNILIPRKLEDRTEQRKRIDFQRVQEYIRRGSKGDLNLRGTFLTKLPDNLTKVGGGLDVSHSPIEDLNNLEYVGGFLNAHSSKLKSLPPKLTRIGGDLSLTKCPINNIDNLEYVGGYLSVSGTKINELPVGLRTEQPLLLGCTPLAKRFLDKASCEEYLEKRNIKVGGEASYT